MNPYFWLGAFILVALVSWGVVRLWPQPWPACLLVGIAATGLFFLTSGGELTFAYVASSAACALFWDGRLRAKRDAAAEAAATAAAPGPESHRDE